MTAAVETAAPKTKAPKQPKEKETTVPAGKKPAAGLTKTAVKIMTAIARNNGRPMTRNDLIKKTGMEKGYSKLFGAVRKEDGGAAGENGLIARGLVKAEVIEDVGIGYTLTAKGRAALAKAAK